MSRVRISFPAPRYPHYFFILCRQAGRRYSQVVRPRSAKPLSPGSNPGGASKKTLHTPCRVFLSFSIYQTCRCGGIGRRKGLKIPRSNIRAGSSPASGTKFRVNRQDLPDFCLFLRKFRGKIAFIIGHFGVKFTFFTPFCYIWELFGNQNLTLLHHF